MRENDGKGHVRASNSWNGYLACSHHPCDKKVAPHITSHDCCGKSKHSRTHAIWERDGRATD